MNNAPVLESGRPMPKRATRRHPGTQATKTSHGPGPGDLLEKKGTYGVCQIKQLRAPHPFLLRRAVELCAGRAILIPSPATLRAFQNCLKSSNGVRAPGAGGVPFMRVVKNTCINPPGVPTLTRRLRRLSSRVFRAQPTAAKDLSTTPTDG
jgi:hypothetical protein